jgi:hypothetical protein
MKTVGWLMLAFSVLLLLCLKSLYSVDYLSPLQIVDDSLNFGRKFDQSGVEWTVRARNNSKVELEIAGFTASCSCVTGEIPRRVIRPGQIVEFPLVMDLRLREGRGDLPRWQDLEKVLGLNVVVNSQGTTSTMSWLLRGVVSPVPVKVVGGGFDFSDELFVGAVGCSRTCRVLTAPSVKSIDVSMIVGAAPRERIDFSVATKPYARNGEFEIRVDATPRGGVCDFNETISVSAVGFDGVGIPCLLIPLSGSILPPVKAIPREQFVTSDRIATCLPVTVNLVSVSGESFTIEEVYADSNVTVSPHEGTANAFDILINPPQSPGTHSQEVWFDVAVGDRIYSIPVTLRYFGAK